MQADEDKVLQFDVMRSRAYSEAESVCVFLVADRFALGILQKTLRASTNNISRITDFNKTLHAFSNVFC